MNDDGKFRTIGRLIADNNWRKYEAYRKRLDNFTRNMKRSARYCTFALRMFHRDNIVVGTLAMQEARYHAIQAAEDQKPQ